MDSPRQRPAGGRFTQWLDGKPIVPADVLPPAPANAPQLTTAPLPIVSNEPVTATPSPIATPISVRGSSVRQPVVNAAASTRDVAGPKLKASEIKEHPVADKILDALSSYQRPYLNEETAETSAHPAASYAAAPVVPGPAVLTPPREARTKLTDSLVKELDTRKAREAGEAAARGVQTVVTRNIPPSTPPARVEEPQVGVAGLPGRTFRPGVIAAVAVIFACIGVTTAVLVSRKDSAPAPASTPLAATAKRLDIPPPVAARDVQAGDAPPTFSNSGPQSAASDKQPQVAPVGSGARSTQTVPSPTAPAPSARSAFPSKSTFQIEN